MGFFDWLFGRPARKTQGERTFNDIEQFAIDQAKLLTEQINESIAIANGSKNVETKISRIGVARDKLDHLERLAERYPFLRIERSDGVRETLSRIEVEANFTEGPGYVDGRHFTNYVEDVKQLKREGRLEEAAGLLLRLIDAVEVEAAGKGASWTIAPWYYEHLGIVYRKLKRKDLADQVAARYAALPGAIDTTGRGGITR